VALRLAVTGFAGAAPLAGACPSYLVSDGEATLLLDCGPGTLERLWRLDALASLDAIVISHMHADHVLDLLMMAGELTRRELGGRRPALYVPALDGPQLLAALHAIFSRDPQAPNRFEEAFEVQEYDAGSRLAVGGLELTFAPSAHPQPCYAARVTDGTASLVYGADGAPADAVEELARDADLVILEATFADDEPSAAASGHSTAEQAGELAARAGARRLLLTHLPPGAGEQVAALAARRFGGEIRLAREGLVYDLA
jgi:ribonuclease BN (tRNA processing enzyme)